MLELAYLHKEELYEKFASASLDFSNMYFYANSYVSYEYKIEEDSWNKIQLVSISNHNILGYMNANIKRAPRYVDSLQIINFTKEPFVFARDLFQFFNLLFFDYNFYKINFSVVIGNSAEKIYDKIIKKYNGRIVGIFKDDVQIPDGTIHDQKFYEVFKEDIENE